MHLAAGHGRAAANRATGHRHWPTADSAIRARPPASPGPLPAVAQPTASLAAPAAWPTPGPGHARGTHDADDRPASNRADAPEPAPIVPRPASAGKAPGHCFAKPHQSPAANAGHGLHADRCHLAHASSGRPPGGFARSPARPGKGHRRKPPGPCLHVAGATSRASERRWRSSENLS